MSNRDPDQKSEASHAGRANAASPAPMAGPPRDVEAIVLSLARELSAEVHPHRAVRATMRGSLDRDWGFDSLTRAELLLRIERSLSIRVPDAVLGEAETLADVVVAIGNCDVPSAIRTASAAEAPTGAGAEPAPQELATLTDVLDWHARVHADRCHIVLWRDGANDTRITYKGLRDAARGIARGLRDAGLEPGERCAIMMATGAAFFESFFGVLYAGGVPVPIYPPSRPSQIAEHLRRQVRIMDNAAAAFLIVAGEGPDIARLLGARVRSLRRVLMAEHLRGGESALPKALQAGAAALIQYTSGSTGDPKGVVLSHNNILANIRAMGAAMKAGPRDVFVSWLPLYHDMGLIGAWLGSLTFAAPLVVMSPLTFLVRPADWLRAIHTYRGTLSAAPNFAFELCVRKIDTAELAGVDLGSLRMVANGSEAVDPGTLQRFRDKFRDFGFDPAAMTPVYGLAENAVGLAFPPPGRPPLVDTISRDIFIRTGSAVPAREGATNPLRFVSCGRPLQGHEIRIVDAAGELGDRQQGELEFRGPSSTSGYFRNPEKSAALFHDGWLRSGDLAYTAEGEVFITGRSKDIVIRAGRHIFPEEIEAAIGEVPGIRKGCVVVFGSPEHRTGTERVVVVAETREADADARAALAARVDEVASAFLDAKPDQVVLVPPRSVPKTSSGKLRRSAARSLYESGALGVSPNPIWLQVASLVAAGFFSRLRRHAGTAAALIYAARWWISLVVIAALAWLPVVASPNPRVGWMIARRLATLSLRLMGTPISVQRIDWPSGARRGVAPDPCIMVANHSSYLDGMILASVLPGPLRFVAKKELEHQRIAGPFLRALGTLFVERADPATGVADALRLESSTDREAAPLVIFPEGTFTRAPGLLPFRIGAFLVAVRLERPVVPVVITGTRSVLRGDQWFPRRGVVRVVILPPLKVDGNDFGAAVKLMDATRSEILAHCGEPDVDNS